MPLSHLLGQFRVLRQQIRMPLVEGRACRWGLKLRLRLRPLSLRPLSALDVRSMLGKDLVPGHPLLLGPVIIRPVRLGAAVPLSSGPKGIDFVPCVLIGLFGKLILGRAWPWGGRCGGLLDRLGDWLRDRDWLFDWLWNLGCRGPFDSRWRRPCCHSRIIGHRLLRHNISPQRLGS
jgi:hypothetical protein